MSKTVTYGNFNLDFATLPETSVMAMLRRGVSHFFGSEMASKVVAAFKVDEETGKTKCGLDDTEENRAAKLAEFRAAAFDAIVAGTVGISIRGPAVDPITKVINRIARNEVSDLLTHNKLKTPRKADETVEIGGVAYTMEQLIARRLDPTGPAGKDKDGVLHVDRITKLATKELADKAKAAEKAAAKAKAEGIEGL